jgi:7-cyano-7-deazaguanine synthase
MDQKILDLTSSRFEKVRRILAEKRQKWEADGDVAYKVAEKVLAKAKAIRETLAATTKKDEPPSKKKLGRFMIKSKTIVLLSGGLDSAVNLYQAHQTTQILGALTFDYGQRAAAREIASAQALCERLQVNHQVVDLAWLGAISKSALNDSNQSIPRGQEVSIDSLEISQQTAQRVWVPNRNGVFLNIGAAYAESLRASLVIPGFNAEEAKTFPDNSNEFMSALDQSFYYSTATQVKTMCYTTRLNKTEIVRLGRQLNVPFELLWPCYQAGTHWCEQCESCQRFLRAMKEA